MDQNEAIECITWYLRFLGTSLDRIEHDEHLRWLTDAVSIINGAGPFVWSNKKEGFYPINREVDIQSEVNDWLSGSRLKACQDRVKQYLDQFMASRADALAEIRKGPTPIPEIKNYFEFEALNFPIVRRKVSKLFPFHDVVGKSGNDLVALIPEDEFLASHPVTIFQADTPEDTLLAYLDEAVNYLPWHAWGTCENCGKIFINIRQDKKIKYCSDSCGNSYRMKRYRAKKPK